MSTQTWANLTESSVQRWVGSLENMYTWYRQHEDRIEKPSIDLSKPLDVDKIFMSSMEQVKKAGLSDEFAARLKTHGYADSQVWVNDSTAITKALLASSFGKTNMSAEQLNQQILTLRNSQLPEAQKRMLEQVLMMSAGVAANTDGVSQEDIKLVSPYRAQVMRILASQ
ncbi:MAG: hypothetical protein P1U57_10630 [Oleibacter sp.]|nr:hypothetical protein [Thalassolituus sp.]